jgi:hypothetical protein
MFQDNEPYQERIKDGIIILILILILLIILITIIIRIHFRTMNHSRRGLKMGTALDASWGYIVPL